MGQPATEAALGELHRLVAESLTEALTDSKDIDDPVLRAAVVKDARAQAIAFLKANSITASPENNAGLAALREKLREKQRNKLTPKQLDDAAEQFGNVYGGNLQ